METREQILSAFLEKILRIENELDALECFSNKLFGLYNTKQFSEQEDLAAKLENAIIVITHESAAETGFRRNDIENLAKYIAFREKYKELDSAELATIIDENPTMEFKKHLSEKLDSWAQTLLQIKTDWNTTFKNADYAKIKNGIK